MGEALGRYILDRKIAEGGMAEVFLARQSGPEGFERVCVVKRMLPAISDDVQMVQMFLNEARLAAQLSHPNIAQIYDFGHVKDSFFLAMEYVPGCSLRALIDRLMNKDTYVPYPVVARILSEAATALDYAHSALGTDGVPLKLIHRDVSPHNILLSKAGTVKLIDFGIAKAATVRQQTVAGTIKGKFAYMSPEQIRGDPLDSRTDIYSLGLVLYELLTNTRAFDGISDHALMEAVYFARFVPPSMLRSDIPVRLLEVLAKTLVKDREARFAVASQMAQALERYISETGTPVAARQLTELVVPELDSDRTGARPQKPPPPVGKPAGRGKRKAAELDPDPTLSHARAMDSSESTIIEQPTDKQRAVSSDVLAAVKAQPITEPMPLRRRAPSSDAMAALKAQPDTVPVPIRTPSITPAAPPPPMSLLAPSTPPKKLADPTPNTLPGGTVRLAQWLARRGMVAAAAGMALALVLAVWLVRRASGHGGARARSSVAVLNFQNLTARPEAAWLSTALSEMIGTELAGSGALRLIPAENVARARAELALPDAVELPAETLSRLRKDLGTDLVTSGAFYALGEKSGGQLRVDVRLHRTSDGETVAALTEQGSEADLPNLVARVGRGLRERLGLPATAGGASPAPGATPEATRLYADGVAALHRYDNLGARSLLEQAIAASPNNPLPYAALSTVWAQLGSDAKAAELAKLALERSQGLPREERLAIEARNFEMSHEWVKARDAYRALWTFFPDNVEYGLGLARVQYSGGDGQGALATLAQLRASPATAADARVDLEEAKAAVSISDYKRAKEAALRAKSRAEASGSKLLQGQALLWEGWASSYLGDNARGSQAEDEARALCEGLGDKACVARALDWAGTVYNDQGDYATAAKRLEASIALAKEIGDGPTHMGALNNLALVEAGEGHLTQARQHMDEAVELAKGLAQRRTQAVFGDSLARILLAQASPEASQVEQDAMGTLQQVGDQGAEAACRVTSAFIDLDRGYPATARGSAEKALGTLRALKMQTSVAEALRALATCHEEQDELELAKKLFDEEAQVMQPLGEEANLASNRVAHARLALEAGDTATAADLARAAADVLHAKRAFDDELTARVLVASALRVGHNLPEAQKALDGASPLARAGENPRSHLRWGIEAARVSGRTGHASQALAALEPLVAEAHKLGLLRLELEARLAAGELELASGQRKKGAATLDTVNKEAAARGLQRLARLSAAPLRD